MSNEKAPVGTIFVCGACGKTARWRYGFDEEGKHDPERSPGWDSSCMTWSVLCHDDETLVRTPGGRVTGGRAYVLLEEVTPTVKVST